MMLTMAYEKLSVFCRWGIAPVANLAARVYIGMEFFRSGLLKLDDWEDTIDMFADDWALPFLPPVPSAFLATAGELVLPLLLIAGLFTRIGAMGLFAMAVVIELFVYPGTEQHYYWMLVLGLLIAYGGDKLSLDNWLLKIKR